MLSVAYFIVMLRVITLIIGMLSVVMVNAILVSVAFFIVMLSVIMLSDGMLNVIMLTAFSNKNHSHNYYDWFTYKSNNIQQIQSKWSKFQLQNLR